MGIYDNDYRFANFLIGFTEKYGTPWWSDDEKEFYKGAIPWDDVEKRLFDWEPIEAEVQIVLPDGNTFTDETRKAIVKPGIDRVFHIPSKKFKIHSYKEWLHDNVQLVASTELPISSAGNLDYGAKAWVQFEAEKLKTGDGVDFRPHLTASTSLDGTMATTLGRHFTCIVCENTYSAAMSEIKKNGQKFSWKHTSNSLNRLQDAREALDILMESTEAFADEIHTLCSVNVSEKDWERFLDEINPIPEEDGRGKTVAQNKRDKLTGLWESDPRVSPWKGTMFGAVQAVSTYSLWEGTVHGQEENPNARVERNMLTELKNGASLLTKETIASMEKATKEKVKVPVAA